MVSHSFSAMRECDYNLMEDLRERLSPVLSSSKQIDVSLISNSWAVLGKR